MHVVPPCNISEAEFNEGVAILDKAFSVIDKHYIGTGK
jgi:taurine--2-oxoglutarate transaminase